MARADEPLPTLTRHEAVALLRWQVEMGADEAIGELAPDRLAPPQAAAVLSPRVAAEARATAPLSSDPRRRAASETRPPSRFAPTPVAPAGAFADSLAEAAQSARALAAQA